MFWWVDASPPFAISKHMVAGNIPSELWKPSGCIHVNHVLSGPAQRMYNCLLAYVRDEIPDIEDAPTFAVPRELLRQYMNTRNDDAIKGWLRELVGSTVEFNNVGKGGPSWGFYTFIQEAEFRGEYVTFGMARTLRGLIADSSMFAKINLLVERKFKKSKYALPLYELGLDYRGHRDKQTGKGVTPWFTLADFRAYMGLQAGEYGLFKELNRAVIERGLAEVRAESDILMTTEFRKESRQVVGLRFHVEDNTANMSFTERLKRLQQTLPRVSDESSMGIEIAGYAEILNRVFGVYRAAAHQIARLYVGRKELFEDVCAKVERDKLAGKVHTAPGAYAKRVFEREGQEAVAPMLAT